MLPDTTATGEIPVRDSITTTSVRKFGGLAGPRERVALLIPICLALEENKARYAQLGSGISGTVAAGYILPPRRLDRGCK